jgi:hypothetical protein
LRSIHEAGRLMTKHLFSKVPIQKGIGNVKLIHSLVLVGGDGEHHAHSAQFNHRHEGFTEVNSGALGEAMNNPFCLVLVEAPVGPEFVLEHPFPSYDISVRWTRHQGPHPVGEQCIIL